MDSTVKSICVGIRDHEVVFFNLFSGTWLMGQSDNIQALSAICSKYNMWMHVVGSNLAALGILSSSIPESIACVPKVADSITVQPREWLAIPMAPRVTLYRDTDPALVRSLHCIATLCVHYYYTVLI